jgi:hypothetical protein
MIDILIDRMMRDIDDKIWNSLLCPQDSSPMLPGETSAEPGEPLVNLHAAIREIGDWSWRCGLAEGKLLGLTYTLQSVLAHIDNHGSLRSDHTLVHDLRTILARLQS